MHAAPDVAVHGGPRDAELAALGLTPGDILDFSVNVNPYGPAPGVVAAVREAELARYPDPSAHATRQTLGLALGYPAESLVLGNGAADLLWTLVRVLVRPGDTVAAVQPTFGELAAAARAAGARLVECRTREDAGFALDRAELDALLARERPRLLYLCSPGNPTGVRLAPADVADLARRHEETIVVLDQAFVSLSQHPEDLLATFPATVVRLRSLTKDHALPGLRVGYLVAEPGLCTRLEAGRPAWSTSAPAQAAVLATVTQDTWLDGCRRQLLSDRDHLTAELASLGVPTHESSTIYLLARVGDATSLRSRLLSRHGILVRDCGSFGLAGHVRLCARPAGDVDRLHSALFKELTP